MLHCVFRAGGPPAPRGSTACLSRAERVRLAGLRIEKRRLDWLRGRRAAKEVAAAALRERWGEAPGLPSLQVDAMPSGAPFLRLALEAPAFHWFAPGAPLPLSLSISHSAGAVFCVASWDGAGLGADVERIESRAASFVGDFFTAEEAADCERAPAVRDRMIAAVWCAKEAVLKALRLGLTVDTREVVCRLKDGGPPGPLGPGWRPFHVTRAPLLEPATLAGWWREQSGFALAVAVLTAEPSAA
jgi:4'-phosphopantetheinyl transferase